MYRIARMLAGGIAAATFIAAANNAFAQSYLDASAKARSDYSGRGIASPRYSAPVVVSSAPTVASRSQTERRSFSLEPAQGAVVNHGGCGAVQTIQPAPTTTVKKEAPAASAEKAAPPATANKPAATRSFSYEPSYTAPATTRARSSVPIYALPKTDPRRLGGG
jgi:hypothetical protein